MLVNDEEAGVDDDSPEMAHCSACAQDEVSVFLGKPVTEAGAPDVCLQNQWCLKHKKQKAESYCSTDETRTWCLMRVHQL